MALLFDKIGKEAKDLLGKSMDTDKKFTFSKTAMDGLEFPARQLTRARWRPRDPSR